VNVITVHPVSEAIPIDRQWRAVRDHARSYADFVFVYPVISRRSGGLSIGINVNPDKVCNFDCVYCEVDRRVPGRAARVDLGQMREELVAMIRFAREGKLALDSKFSEVPVSVTTEIRDIAFSGDGEPTMISNFAECVQVVAEVKRAERLERTRMVLITDAAGLDKADVRRGLKIMDANQGEVWGKLDAGTEPYYRLVNRSRVVFGRILKNLALTAQERAIVIQSLFLRVHGEVMPRPELDAYCDRLNEIVGNGGRIREVQVYTVARPTPEPYATRLERGELETMAGVVRERTGLKVLVFE
jgi:wyosine [tRNA(Phe)-imidazoG37] synthetase (radical SAM superfamily)